MTDDRYLAALTRFGAAETWHYGTTLLQHLQGTREILAGWGARDALCLAGLFHSVYGTAYFQTETADVSRRQEIRALIGGEAEDLVFLFCRTDRQEFFGRDPTAEEIALRDRVSGAATRVGRSTLRDLVEIHVANDLEVVPHILGNLETAKIVDALALYERHREWLSPPAMEAVRELMVRLRADLHS